MPGVGPIKGAGATNKLAKFTGSNLIGDSLIREVGGKVGIGVAEPGSQLSVAGMIESLSGGIKFPDETIQKTAANVKVFNVRDFGAIGSGSEDDTAKIQAAIEAAAVSGGTVYVPPGTYKISSGERAECLTLHSNIALIGAGASSALRLADGEDTWSRMLTTDDGATNVVIRDLRLDGNAANQAPANEHQHAILLVGVTGARVENCVIHDTRGDGVYAYQGTPGASRGVIVSHNRFHGNWRVAINFAGASYSIAESNIIQDTHNYAMKMEADAGNLSQTGNTFVNNRVWNVGGGISLTGSAPDKPFRQMRIEGNYFQVDASVTTENRIAINLLHIESVQVVGNHVEGGLGSGIYADRGRGLVISGNEIHGLSQAEFQYDAAINLGHGGSSQSISDVVVANNILYDNLTPGIRVQLSGAGLRPSGIAIISNNINGSSTPGSPGNGGGILAHDVDNVRIQGNTLRNNGGPGIFVAQILSLGGSKHVQLTDNRIFDDPGAATPTTTGIQIDASSDYMMVTGNDAVGLSAPASIPTTIPNLIVKDNFGF